MKTLFAAVGTFLFFSCPVWAQNQAAPFTVSEGLVPPLRGTLRAGASGGVLIEPPQEIAAGGVRDVMATQNGGRVIALRQYYPPTPASLAQQTQTAAFGRQTTMGEASVVVWNAFTRKSSTVWRYHIEAGDQFSSFFSGTLHAASGERILVVARMKKPGADFAEQIILLVDADKNTVRQVRLPDQDAVQLLPAPQLPFAALVKMRRATESNLQFLKPDGSLTKPIVFPGVIWWRDWKKNGTILSGVQDVSSADPNPDAGLYRWFDADPQTGQLTLLPARPEREPDPKPAPPETLDGLQLITRPPAPETGAQTASVWLEAKETKTVVLLSAEGVPVFLLPRAAVFLSNHALYAAPLQTVRLSELVHIEKEQNRLKDTRTVRQVGQAMLNFMLGNSENFPATARGLAADLNPHLSDPHLLDGFVYAPPTPLNQAGMDKPFATVLGYLPGDGGKTVLYADGHVKWEDTP